MITLYPETEGWRLRTWPACNWHLKHHVAKQRRVSAGWAVMWPHAGKRNSREVSLSQFWCSSVISEHPSLHTRAVKARLPCSTAHLCEGGLSALVQLETKHKNRLHIEHDLTTMTSLITTKTSEWPHQLELQTLRLLPRTKYIPSSSIRNSSRLKSMAVVHLRWKSVLLNGL